MKSVYLASVLALVLGASGAFAATPVNTTAKDGATVQSSVNVQHSTQTQADMPHNDSYDSIPDYEANDSEITKDVKSGLRKADSAMRETADDIRAFFVGDEGGGALEPVMIRSDRTAKGLLDKPVLNPQGKEITKLKDIIIDQNGRATMVVVTDGGFLGIGKKQAAFDYSKVIAQQNDGKVVMALSQDMIDRAADFSYDEDDASKARIIPAGSVSLNDVLDGNLLDSKGKKVGAIENVSFENGRAHRIIVGFNKTLGMGGDLAALNYASLEKLPKMSSVDVKMNASQSAQFSSFGKSSRR